MFDFMMAIFAIGFGLLALLGQHIIWNVVRSVGSVDDTTKLEAEWKQNLRFSGGAALVLGTLLLAALLLG